MKEILLDNLHFAIAKIVFVNELFNKKLSFSLS